MVIGVVIFMIGAVFVHDCIGELIFKETKKLCTLLIPLMELFALYFVHTFTHMYTDQRLIIALLYNFCMSSIILNLMLHNMTKRHYSMWQPSLIFIIAPLAIHFALQNPLLD